MVYVIVNSSLSSSLPTVTFEYNWPLFILTKNQIYNKTDWQLNGDAPSNFFETGGAVLALYPWSKLAQDAALPDQPRPDGFRGMTLAWNCASAKEVDAVMAFAVAKGASMLKAPHRTDYGGYSGYFADPDGHPWEVVVAPGIEVGDDRRVHLPD